MKVLHVITSLCMGGTQVLLHRLIRRMNRMEFEAEVVSLSAVEPVGDVLGATGVRVRSLGMNPGVPDPFAVVRLSRWIRESGADLVVSWLYHADLVAGLAARLEGRIPVIWCIHYNNPESSCNRLSTLWTAKMCAWLSEGIPSKIVCCSQASMQSHQRLGYSADRMEVIPNGVDVEEFRPDEGARDSVRDELGLPRNVPLIGMVARFDPQKDHRTFFEAAGYLSAKRPGTHFLLCGEGMDARNTTVRRWIHEIGMEKRCHLLGLRSDVPRLTAALDISTLSSREEAFPNVIVEAMACGVPVAVTNVGDACEMVSDAGRVVEPGEPASLSVAWEELLSMGAGERGRLGEMGRRRAMENYSIEVMARRYEAVFREAGCAGEKNFE